MGVRWNEKHRRWEPDKGVRPPVTYSMEDALAADAANGMLKILGDDDESRGKIYADPCPCGRPVGHNQQACWRCWLRVKGPQ